MASKQNWEALNEALRRSAERMAMPTGGGDAPVGSGYVPGTKLYDPEVDGRFEVEERPEEPGFLDRLFDIISRPAYALNNAVKDTIDKDPNTDNILESLWAGFSGIDKTRGHDVIREMRESKGDYRDSDNDFAVGLAWDLFTDPLNVVPMGWLGKAASKGYQGVTKGKAAVKGEEGFEIPGEATAAQAVANQTPPPGAAGAAPTPSPGPGPTGGGGGGSPMPGAAPTPAGAPGSASAQNAYNAGRARAAAAGGAAPTPPPGTTSAMPTIGQGAPAATPSGFGNFNAFTPTGPKPQYDLDQIGENLRNLTAPPTGRQGVGLNGPAQVASKFEGQEGMFGLNDLERISPKPTYGDEPFRYVSENPSSRFQAGPDGIKDLTIKGTRPRPLVSERAVKDISGIPTGWLPGTKDAIKDIAQKKPLPKWLKDMMAGLPPASKAAADKVDTAAVVSSKLDETQLIDDAVAAKVTDTPGVIHPVDGSAPPHVTMPETTGSIPADVAAAAGGARISAAAENLVETTAARTGQTIAETAAQVTGKVPIVVETAARAASDSPVLRMSDQYKSVQNLTGKAWAETAGMAFKERKVSQQASVMTGLKAERDANIAKGIYPEMNTLTGASYKLHSWDMYEVMGPGVTAKMQFSKEYGIPISSQMAGAAKTIEMFQAGKGADEAIAAITDTMKKAHHTQQVFNKRAATFARQMWAKREELWTRAVDNEAAFKTRDAVIGKDVGNKIGDDIAKIIKDPEVGVGDKLNAVNQIPKAADKAARAKGASAGGAAVASATAGARIAENVIESDIQTAQHVARSNRLQAENAANVGRGAGENPYVSWNTQPQQGAKARRAQQNAPRNGPSINSNQRNWANQQINNAQRAAALAGTQRIDIPGVVTDGLFRRMLDGFLGAISGGYAMGKIFPAGRQVFNHYSDSMIRFNNIVQRARANHDPLDVLRAFEAVRARAGASGLNAAEKAAYDDLMAMAENTLPLSIGINSWGDASAYRNGFDIDTINQVMRKHDLGMAHRPKDNHLEVPEQWMEKMDIEDPIGFLVKYRQVQMELAGHGAVGRFFSKEFGSLTKKPGMVKVARSNDVDMSHFVDLDMYYLPEHIDMLGRYSREIMKNVSFSNKIMKDWIDPYLSVWKVSATILRVSHHIRNFIGDTLFTGMDGAKYMNPANNVKALRVQKATGRASGPGGMTGKSNKVSVVDELADLNKLLGNKPPKPGDKALTVTLKGGNAVALANNEIEYYAHGAGLMMDYRHLQDILEASGGGLNKAVDAINDTRAIQAIGKMTELSSNNTRLSHLIGLMSDPKVTQQYDSVESMVRGLSARVLKFHPDASGLSKFEQKYMRRIFPFYTWFKQAAPTMFMTTLTHPQRPVAIDKVHQNLQGMLGMDIEQGEDFPEGSYYPDFLRKSLLGPLSTDNKQGTMVDYGSPTEAMASILQGNVGGNVAGMLNPLVKTPLGLWQGHQPLSPDHFIPDQSEWVDQALPGVNQFSNLTGLSGLGSLGTLAAGEGLDPQRAMVKGEKDFLFNQNMKNYFLPFNMQNTDRESYFNIARQENQQYQEDNDPFIWLKKRVEEGRLGRPSVSTGGMSE